MTTTTLSPPEQPCAVKEADTNVPQGLAEFRSGRPGVYRDIDAATYHQLDACSASRLKKLARSALHCKESIDHPGAPTPAMMLGTAEHLAILQPDLFPKTYRVADQCKATKKNGERCTNTGKTFDGDGWWCGMHVPSFLDITDPTSVLTPDDYARCQAMHAAVWAHPAARKALASAESRELSVLWVDAKTGQLCKIRVDQLCNSVAWDVKCTQDASPEGFAWSVRKFKYDLQAAFYLRGLVSAGIRPDGFGFIAVESEAPHAVGVYTLDDADLSEADADIFHPKEGLLTEYADCRRTNAWSGYSPDLTVLRLPMKRKDPTA